MREKLIGAYEIQFAELCSCISPNRTDSELNKIHGVILAMECSELFTEDELHQHWVEARAKYFAIYTRARRNNLRSGHKVF